MKIRISFSRKIGLPEYSSAGASTEIEIELPEGLGADGLVSQARSLYATARRSVEEQLDQLGGAEPADVAPTPPPPTTNGRANGHQFASEQARFNGRSHEAPATGKQLFRVLKDREEAGETGLLKSVNRWAKAKGFDGRIVEWSEEQVAAAVAEIDGEAEEPEAPGVANARPSLARPYRRPAPIGHGFGHRY